MTVVLYSLHAVTSSVIYYSTHPRKNLIYLFYTKKKLFYIKIQMVYWRIFGAWKKKNQSADVIWRGFDVICVCPFNRSRSTTNENAHCRVTLLYKIQYHSIHQHYPIYFANILYCFSTPIWPPVTRVTIVTDFIHKMIKLESFVVTTYVIIMELLNYFKEKYFT